MMHVLPLKKVDAEVKKMKENEIDVEAADVERMGKRPPDMVEVPRSDTFDKRDKKALLISLGIDLMRQNVHNIKKWFVKL